MPDAVLRRAYSHTQVTIVANTCESEALDVRAFTMGAVRMPNAWTGAALGFTVAPTRSSFTFQPLYADLGSATVLVQCSSVQAGRTYTLPPEICAPIFMRIWSQASGANVNQAAARVLEVTLKG